MHRPVLVQPPAVMPVSLEEAKAHLRVEHNDDDALIISLVMSATAHLDGWTGILGRCLVDQTWRQAFDGFARCLRLPLGPVIGVESVTWRNSAGQMATVSPSDYRVLTDGLGSYVRFRSVFQAPTDLNEVEAVTLTYRAGYETDDGEVTVPHAIRQAMLLLVGHWYEHRETVVTGTIATNLPQAVDALLAPYRVWAI